MIRRTFHIEGENGVLDIQEQGTTVSIRIGALDVSMTREQFTELCSIKYDLRWDFDIPLSQESLPL